MSSQTEITALLKLKTQGLKEGLVDSEKLNKSLEQGQAIANRSKAVSAGYKAAKSTSENVDYGVSRGTIGTGAGARDFAKESQGLGGLVRLYATVAANAFAATAAFNALSNAMNTTNMVQGLNQLGAASGVALGSLSKQLVEASYGAISLKDAMSATAQATSAGISSKQLKELTIIARNASQALGRDMGDSLTRLTRSVTKLEPELIDELGLFSKIGPATDAYAKSIGKTATSLNAFEKNQAFLNAVLAEGNQKYSEISIDANPYQQLQASLSNLTQTGLEFINKFLTPLASVLASNTLLLGTVVAGLGLKLLGMAVPAFTSWRDELTKSAQTAKDKAREINESFGEKFVERTNAAFKIPELEKNLKEAEAKYAQSRKNFVEIDNNYKRKNQSKVFADVSQNTITDDTIVRMQKEINAKTKEGTEDNLKHAASLKAIKDARLDVAAASKALTTGQDAALIKADNMSAEDWARAQISRRAGSRADRLNILSQVGSNVEGGGFGYAMDTMREQIKKSTDMGPWAKFSTGVKGTLAAVTTQVGIFGSALQGILGWIGLVVTVTGLLVSAFSRAGDETKAFNSSLDLMDETIKTANATYEKFKDTISTGSLAAKGNSLTDLGDQLDDLVVKLDKIEAKAGWADRLSDTVATALGGGIRKNFGEKIGASISAQLKLIPAGPLKDAAETQIRSILNINGEITKDSISSKVYWMGSSEEITTAVKKLSTALKPAQSDAKELSVSAQGLASALTTAGTASQTLLASLQSNDPLVKYGESLVNLGSQFKASTNSAQGLVAAVKDLQSKPDAIKLMSSEQYTQMIKFNETLPGIVKTLDTYQVKLSELQNTKLGLDKAINNPKTAQGLVSTLIEQRDKIVQEINKAKLIISLNKGAFTEIQSAIIDLSNKTILAGYKMIGQQVTFATQQAAINFQKSILSGVSGPGISAANAKLDLDLLGVQRQQITATERLNETLILSNVINSKRAAQESSASITAEASKTGKISPANVELLKQNESIIGGSDALINSINSGKNLVNSQITGLDPASQATYTQLQTLRSQKGVALAGNAGQAKIVEAQGRYGTAKEEADSYAKILSARTKTSQLEESIFNLRVQGLPYLTEAQLSEQKAIQDTAKKNQNLEETNAIEAQIADIKLRQKDADFSTFVSLGKTITQKQKELDVVKERQATENGIASILAKQLVISEKSKAAAIRRDIASKAEDQKFGGAELELQIRSELLGIESQLGKYSEQEIADKEKTLKLDTLAFENVKNLALAERKRVSDTADIQTKIDQAKAANPLTDTSALEEQKTAVKTYYDNEIALIARSNDAKTKAVDLTYSMSKRMEGFSKIVEDAFGKLGDALEEFARTGKLDFEGLVNSMISDLVRFELRAQTSKMYKDAGGLSGIVGSFMNTVSPVEVTPELLPGFDMRAAKGAAWDYGVEAFARGGTFTNSIVDSPTLFKFARGTGLMGEAGPEAIMPLKRDSQGNLGVRSGSGGEVSVVVNNYSTSEATTKETTDSNGNRRIEVIIGDIVAKEVGRANSPINAGMKANFQLQPNLVRR
jgi:lambda family phage tail tape measure protein